MFKFSLLSLRKEARRWIPEYACFELKCSGRNQDIVTIQTEFLAENYHHFIFQRLDDTKKNLCFHQMPFFSTEIPGGTNSKLSHRILDNEKSFHGTPTTHLLLTLFSLRRLFVYPYRISMALKYSSKAEGIL